MTPRRFLPLVLLVLAAPGWAAEPRYDPDGVPLPDGCLARLGSTRFRAWETLTGPVFTPAGELLFAELEGESVHFRFMDARTGLFVRKATVRPAALAGNGSVQQVLGLSDDGRAFVVLTAEAGTGRSHLVTWDIARHAVAARIPMDVRGGVPPFADNLRWFARFDRDTGDVIVTDARTGHARTVCRLDTEERPELFPAPDGRTVVVGIDAAVLLLEVETGHLLRQVVTAKTGHALSGISARYSPDGGTVAVRVSGKDQLVGVWRCDTRTGKVQEVNIKAEDEHISSVSPDGARMIATGRSFPGELLLDLRTDRRLEVHGSSRAAVRFDAAGERFVTHGRRQVTIHDAGTGAPLSPPADLLPRAVRFQHDGRTVAVFDDETGTEWDAGTGRRLRRFDRPKEWRGQPFADGRLVFAETPDGLFALHDPLTEKPLPGDWKALANAKVFEVTPCGRFVVAAFSNDGMTRLFKYAIATGKVLGEVRGLPIRVAAGLTISADGDRAVVSSAEMENGGGAQVTNAAVVCDLAGGAELHRFPPFAGIANFRLSGDGARLLAVPRALFDGAAAKPVPAGLYHPTRGTKEADADFPPTAVEAASGDGRMFAVGDADGRVRVIEAATGHVRAEFRHKDAITALAFAPDGATLAAASNDAPVYLWDVRGKLLNLSDTLDEASGVSSWVDLASNDGGTAFDAMRRLAAAPDAATKLFARLLPPAAVPAQEWVTAKLKELESRSFAVRERATVELAAVAEVIQPRLRAELVRSESPEVRKRLTRVLGAIGSNSAERLRALRAVEVLEWVRTPAATELLKSWAAGPDRAPLTVAARQAVNRR